jgi:phosphoglucomutase
VSGNAIHFGTSGWRAVIGDGFTFGGVRVASGAIAGHLKKRKKRPHVLVGYDRRFLSPEFALAAARVLHAEECKVLLSDAAVPTPALAFEIRRAGADGAINITASHNPADYNGLKFSGADGGPALPEVTSDLEQRAAAMGAKAGEDSGEHDAGNGQPFNPREDYFRQLERLVRFDVIGKSGAKFVCDALHGCGAGYLDEILRRHGVEVKPIRMERDVLFDGTAPDPSEENTAPLREAVKSHGMAAGLATDGDADRFGIVDSDGSYVSPNYILALVFDYLIQTRESKGGAARSVATTHLVDAVARLWGRQVYQTPVGFKYIGAQLLEDNILLGGEESSGMTIEGHVPEKDGILACLLVAEMIVARGTSLGEQLRDLFRRVGAEYWPVRLNIPLPESAIEVTHKRLGREFQEFDGRRVTHTDRTDGLQLTFDDGAWILMRPSGTEPLVRVYAEAGTEAEAHGLAASARKWVTQ